MYKSDHRTFSNTGYRKWFESFLYNQRQSMPIFILDYETHSIWEDTYDSYDDFEDQNEKRKSKQINGIQIYFLDEEHKKRKAFLRHSPYFFLLVEEELSQSELNRISSQIREIGERKIIEIEVNQYFDAAHLTFLEKRYFIKVIVDRPASVPHLRTKCESISGVIEWREADVLFHHRCAIDHSVRVGAWYQADIRGNEIQSIKPIRNKAPPNLKILAYDIETVFEQTRDPNPNRDEISMICMFTGEKNTLLVNSNVVETDQVRNIDILLQPDDQEHTKPWVDWAYSKSTNNYDSVLEHYFVNVIVLETEKELLTHFYNFISKFQPDVLADFFGGRFDIPFIAIRSEKYNLSLEKETGFKIVFRNQGRGKRIERKDLNKKYTPASLDYVEGAGIIHLDAWLFNEKYSYLPKKDLGLKPSVEKKLKIIPIGREALFAINEKPEEAVAYAGCDGYITWKYVKEIVMEFFLSLGQMFPVPASELLARRAGSLDDLLIDAEGFKNGIIGKRKIQTPDISSFSDRISIDSLAYTGGLVEARRPGIFRSDIYYDFKPDKTVFKELINIIRKIIKKESNSLSRKVVKEEYEKSLIAELGGMKVEYNGDQVSYLKNVELEFLKNGLSEDKRTEKIDRIRRILEKSSAIYVDSIDKVTDEIISKIEQLSELKGKTQLRGIHVDVTSMYPSQIRQFKLQPSGIIPLSMCRTCELYEEDDSCFFEGDWVIKLTSRRPCRFKESKSETCDPSVCTSNSEAKCRKYEPISLGISNSQEVFAYNNRKSEAYRLSKNGKLEKTPLEHTYLGKSTKNDPYASLQRWLRNTVDATQLSKKLGQNHSDIFEDQPEDFQLPSNTFMSIDVRSKKITVLLSVRSRVCQKSYNFVARIMDDFFNTRVHHKFEAQRLKQLISQKQTRKQPVSAEFLRQQKFHDSTQLGMKVPLNSIYGLLGMKAGVRNASTPCAGITTKLSADIVHWAAEELEKIGLVTELDTDGVWLWLPKLFPLTFPVTIVNSAKKDDQRVISVSLIDKILNEKVTSISRNDNYWNNDGHNIIRSSKNLIKFEQDGPYDFQFVMGKKKYIVYNYDKKSNSWVEKELTGLESKRADFSKLQKHFQEQIINSYLEDYNPKKPIQLSQLYENASKTSELIRTEMEDGNLDPSYFVKPKAINKPLNAYKSKLPQVSAAYILKDLGFSVEPGIRIQMLNIKGNHVIPSQIFDFPFKKIKEVLINHAICTLDFMVGDLSTKDDLRKLIDVRQYVADIFGPGRIFDRMVRYPMEVQQITIQAQTELDLSNIKHISRKMTDNSQAKDKKVTETPRLNEEEKLIELKVVRQKSKKKLSNDIPKDRKNAYRNTKRKSKGLEALFKQPIPKTASAAFKANMSKSINKNKKKKPSKDTVAEIPLTKTVKKKDKTSVPSSKVVEDVYSEKTEDKILVSSDEITELETQDIFTNGVENGEKVYSLSLEAEEGGRIVCSECGALVDPEEITDEGCKFCGGNIIVI